MPPSISRRVAHYVLVRVERDGAYADRALDAALRRAPMDARDRALATELVYGTLRQQIALDFYLARLATKPLSSVRPEVLNALRLGAYQLLSTRVPAHAAISESVDLARRTHPHAAGFVNAVLRRLAAQLEHQELPKPQDVLEDPMEALAVETSHPVWMLREAEAVLGPEEVRAWAEANNRSPGAGLRINGLKADREAVARALRAAGAEVEVPELFPDGLVVHHGGRVTELPGFEQGHFVVQDLGAQLVARMVAPAPGAFVLDACAAPGGKATHLAEMVGAQGTVLAVDIHPAKTRLIAAAAARLGFDNVKVAALDATAGASLAELLRKLGRTAVDAVLLDAPCSGLGTLARNPELRTRRPSELGPLCSLQDKLLDAVSQAVGPGGVLVYAVCTITGAEGPERVAAFLKRHPDFAPEAPSDPSLRPFLVEIERAGLVLPALATWPHRHGCDGFFAVRLRRGP